MEMKLLKYFVQNEGRIISRMELLENVWDLPGNLNTRSTDQFIRRLRKAFEPRPASPRHFLTFRDAGWRFVAEPEKHGSGEARTGPAPRPEKSGAGLADVGRIGEDREAILRSASPNGGLRVEPRSRRLRVQATSRPVLPAAASPSVKGSAHQPRRIATMQNPSPLWYKDAIIYQLHVRSFYDANDDGIGDFRGLTRKLDYLQDLGITAIWLLPFYPSPWRDDGYDIADYYGVHPKYGTLHDFRTFLREAHERGLRVITELVLNHTSDEHPWFRRARTAKAGSRWRDFYVWSETSDRYRDARIIFKDFEQSNWAWDPVAGAYFWHRFYHHQPDLNFDNPEVREAMLQVVDHWFGMGVDGMRLDAVPYLFEREGTSCENLPETHAFLKELRAHVDARFQGRMLLAEANQWPEDAVQYFGTGDECHAAFHFPLMPRIFIAVHMEDRFPIVDTLQQTPAIPDVCQWMLFLRNHDELTLEMVTEEERDYMYRVYARDPQARINLGHPPAAGAADGEQPPQHRVAQRSVALAARARRSSTTATSWAWATTSIWATATAFARRCSGAPTGTRAFPTPARSSSFSPWSSITSTTTKPSTWRRSRRNAHSLLSWMKRLIALRQQSRALGHGTVEILHPSNPKVLAFIRRLDEARVLVVANLSRFAQYVELDLASLEGHVPVELFGQGDFPRIGKTPYLLTLGPHAFLLVFHPAARAQSGSKPQPASDGKAAGEPQLATLEVEGDWDEVFEGTAAAGTGAALAPVPRLAPLVRRQGENRPRGHDLGRAFPCVSRRRLTVAGRLRPDPSGICRRRAGRLPHSPGLWRRRAGTDGGIARAGDDRGPAGSRQGGARTSGRALRRLRRRRSEPAAPGDDRLAAAFPRGKGSVGGPALAGLPPHADPRRGAPEDRRLARPSRATAPCSTATSSC